MKITVHFVGDTTAEVGLNNYVYSLKKLSCYVGNPRSHRKHRETPS